MHTQFKQLRLIALFVLIITLLVGSSFILHQNFNTVSEQEWWVLHTSEVINELNQTLSAAKDAETGVRGYLLSHREEYLEPYRQGLNEAFEHVSRVKYLTQDNNAQQVSVAVLDEDLKKRFAALNALLDKFQHNGGHLTMEELHSSEGKSLMDSIRMQVGSMISHEEGLLAKRRERSENSRSVFLWMLILSTGIICVVTAVAFFQIGANQRKVELESREKSDRAREKEMVAQLGRSIAGDISLQDAGMAVLQYLAENMGILAGKIWTFGTQRQLELVAALATSGNAGDQSPEQTNLVKAAIQRETEEIWRITDVPESYWKISSGLGGSAPSEVLFLPVAFQGKRIGVIELASFAAMSSESLRLLRSFGDIVGVGLNAAQSRTWLQTLLEKTQLQSEELQTQQEELKTNNEELEQQARALESQQQALNLKNRELEERALELQRSSQYKSEFLAKMSHELRTPLNGLLILSTLLIENKERNLTEQQRQFAKSINNAGNDLLMLINDILDLSKIEARKLVLQPEEFHLKDLFDMNRRSFEPQANSKGLQLKMELGKDMQDVRVYSDRQRLEQILRNFLSNAIKFTEAGSVSMGANMDSSGEFLTLTVSDTGIGIPKNKQQTIFEAFEQADGSISRKYGGTGLGLTISRELAGLLGGKITIVSEEGKGSQFSVRIPLRLAKGSTYASAANVMPAEELTIPRPRESLNHSSERIQQQATQALAHVQKDKKTILIVEDDAGFRSSIVDTVRANGFEAIEAGDGEVALAIVNEHSPDAILLDIKLPGISGLGILEMIKQMPHLRHIPVHMISALEYQHNALRLGALGYLTKPVTIEKVRSALGRIENIISKKLRRVLLIEDDERQNEAIYQLISGTDLEVVSVKTGKAAVAELKSKGFDCIILDLTLPDVSGFDLLSELRALEISLPPVVIYTGKDLSDEEERYLRKYSESIVIKGARSPERLLDEVNLFLHRVESFLPESKREMLSHMRSQEKTFEGKTILIADDDIRNVFALTSALESRNLQTRVARDGAEALQILEQYPDVDLVLMDIMMPKMDGFEAMRNIRKSPNPHIRSMPIIALTAKAMKDDHEKCIEAGANDYLPKPVNLDNLTTVLKVWLAPNGFDA